MSQFVNVRTEDNIAFLSMNRPEKRNALSVEMANELLEALHTADQDEDVKVIILSGEGKAFSAGGDLETLKRLNNTPEIMKYMNQAMEVIETIRKLDKYVISAVHGFAAGAGFSIALAADFVVASSEARFISSFTNIGIIPDLGLIKALTERLPPSIVKEWVTSGKSITAQEAFERGLVNRIADGNLLTYTAKFAQFIIDGPPLANRFVKQLVNHADELTGETNRMQETAIQTLLLQTEDNKEGILAFFEKRKPLFKGE
ncbi:enoyl-CoA hydratase/isomerase family protein [Oceanobacillus chungangensis]|uniref:Enoyl-CoA hydratase/isomerase family protein n=1 Tax=Oceanobacillus chungangensis TaxID=1229152 RepID=A0A3D8PJU4_9BACI|nr:enoyl-CoA hydratase/isomerase family protein [Oceanobacillus chungangensis]RDW15499.1 enoyl-CoA hydratase/isomerase family protein [Oceanobacillus chungangensis]